MQIVLITLPDVSTHWHLWPAFRNISKHHHHSKYIQVNVSVLYVDYNCICLKEQNITDGPLYIDSVNPVLLASG